MNVSGSNRRGKISTWDYFKGQLVKTCRHGHNIKSLAWIKNSALIILTHGYEIEIWYRRTGEPDINLKREFYFCAIRIPETDFMVSNTPNKRVKVWDYKKKECVNTFRIHQRFVYSLAYIPKTQYVVSGSDDETIRIWNYNTGTPFKILRGHK